METRRDKALRKIRALAARTKKAGASQAEALASVKLAKKLMQEYEIEKDEIPVKRSFDAIPSKTEAGRHMSFIYAGYIARLFKCRVYSSGKRAMFFGDEINTELARYTYDLVRNAQTFAMKTFKASDEYEFEVLFSSARTLMKAYSMGFEREVAAKLYNMLPKQSIGKEGLILAGDEELERAYAALDLRTVNRKRYEVGSVEADAYRKGLEAGASVNITEGLESATKQNALDA